MEETKKHTVDKPITVDTRRGVVYYDDFSCFFRKFHAKGIRNIYSVVLKYAVEGSDLGKTIRMDYGSFTNALERFYLERFTKRQPKKMKLAEISILASTFDGDKLIYEDVLGSKKSPMFQKMNWEEDDPWA